MNRQITVLFFLFTLFLTIKCSNKPKNEVVGIYQGEKTLHGEAKLIIQKKGEYKFKEESIIQIIEKDSGKWSFSNGNLFLNSFSNGNPSPLPPLFKNQKLFFRDGKILIPDSDLPNSILHSYIFEKVKGDSTKKNISVFPTKIEFGSIGKGSNRPPTIIIIDKEFVKIATSKGVQHTYSTAITNLDDLILNLHEKEIKGKKHFYHPFMRDGGYLKISNKKGIRQFTNTFNKTTDKSMILPDTIGLSKFEAISESANQLLQRISN